jgi:Apea-like HEPN
MKGLYITALDQISTTESLGRGFEFRDTYFLTNDKSVTLPLVASIEKYIGPIESNHIRKAPAVIYSLFPAESPPRDHTEALRDLGVHLRFTELILLALWYVKDNAVSSELGFLRNPHSGHPSEFSVASNQIITRATTADGRSPSISFSLAELRAARAVVDRTDPVSGNDGEGAFVESIRFERAGYFVQAARSSAAPGVKITHYVTALEALFGTDNQELSHKLSERVAFFLGETPEERLNIFARMKAAYTVRSRTVHGAPHTAKGAQSIPALAQTVDSLARRSLVKISSSEGLYQLMNGNDAGIDEYFVRLIFGAADPELDPT